MAVRLVMLAVLTLACGCASHRSYEVADPVVGPAPPRIPNAEQVAMQSPEEPIGLASHESGPIPVTGVVARVNGSPILAGDVLEEYVVKLQTWRQQTHVSDEQFRKAQETLLKQLLPHRIEQKLLVDAVKSKLKKEQLEQLEKQLDKGFELWVADLKRKFKVETTADLEELLQQNGMSLVTMRRQWGDNQLAIQYVQMQMGEEKPITRQQLLDAYEANKSDFELPAQVKWQQLQVSVSEHGGEQKARQFLEKALAEYETGVDFDTIVQTYSDGPLAKNGGHWDWMQSESIASGKLREAVETVAVGEVSGIIATDQYLQVIKVNGRRPHRYTPFEEVQEQLRGQISSQRREEAAREIIANLKETAVIESILDGTLPTGKNLQGNGIQPAGAAG